MKRLIIAFAALLHVVCLGQLPVPVGLTVTVNTNGVVTAPANFWAANSNSIASAQLNTNAFLRINTNGTIAGPTNFFVANSNALVAVTGAGGTVIDTNAFLRLNLDGTISGPTNFFVLNSNALVAVTGPAGTVIDTNTVVRATTNGLVTYPGSFWTANSNALNAVVLHPESGGGGGGTTYRFDTNSFLLSGTNVSLAATRYLTSNIAVQGGLSYDVNWNDLKDVNLDGQNLNLSGSQSADLSGGLTYIRGATNLYILTTNVVGNVATVGQVLTLQGIDGRVEFALANDTSKLLKAGDTMSGALNMGSQRITSLGSPAASSDAATRAYVDTAVGNVNVAAAFPDSMGEITRLRQAMAGLGRVGLLVWPRNNETAAITTNNGDGFTIARTVRRVPTVGEPQYWYLREIGTNHWFGYYTTGGTFGTTNTLVPSINYYRTLRPMLRYRVDAGAAVTDEDGGAVAYPMLTNAANDRIQFNTTNLSTSVRRLGVILGATYTFGSLCKVTITNNATGANVIPNMLPTVQQGINSSSWATSVTNLAELTLTDYVLDTQGIQMMLYNGWHIPLADNLEPGSYLVTIQLTQSKNSNISHTGSQRAYISHFTYATDATTEATTGATLELWGPGSYRAATSTSETFTFDARPAGLGSYELIGNGHFNAGRSGEQIDTLQHQVDGEVIIPWSRTSSRARASNVATIVTSSPHGLQTGDLVTLADMSASAYNAEDLAVTVTSATSFTALNTGGNESTTADTGGYVIRQNPWIGRRITQHRTTSIWHSATNSPLFSTQGTYIFDMSGWASSAVVTANHSHDLSLTTYLGLNTVYGGASWGPEFTGQTGWRVIGTTTSGTFDDANTTSVNLTSTYGRHAGFVVWGPTRATAYFAESPNLQMQNWQYGSFFAQDRGENNGARGSAGVSKFYFQYITTNAVTGIPAGTVYRIRCTRLDAELPRASTILQ
jgi:hypothetical protein